MKKYIILLTICTALATSAVYSQEQRAETEALVKSKTFVFVGSMAYPMGQPPVDLASNTNLISFTPELIQSDMPFYGTGYSGMAMGRDTGMRFSGKPEDYTVVTGEKAHEITLGVRGETDTYFISVIVGFEGSATLTISSNNRSTISYHGEIVSRDR